MPRIKISVPQSELDLFKIPHEYRKKKSMIILEEINRKLDMLTHFDILLNDGSNQEWKNKEY